MEFSFVTAKVIPDWIVSVLGEFRIITYLVVCVYLLIPHTDLETFVLYYYRVMENECL